MTEMVFGVVPVKPGEPLLPRWWRTVDTWTLLAIIGLFAAGLMLGLAASPPLATRNGLDPFYYVSRQAFFGMLALTAMVVTSMLTPRQLRRLGVIGFGFAFVALALLPVLGTDFGKGAVRWYSLGFASVQPSEFLKPAFVILTAWLMAANYEPGGPPGRAISFWIAVLLVGLLVVQPDFGQASLVLGAWGLMYFVAGASMFLLMILAALVMAGGVMAYRMSDHVARRIDGFLSPDLDPRTQLGFATNAIQEGGILGVGVGEGTVKWSLPDAHTDFIIAVAAEEYGLVMCLVIILLFGTIVVRSMVRLVRERDPFVRLAGTGLAAMFGLQALINMGVAVRLLPAKGMTLPFVSYGGSSLLAAGIALGMLLALTRERPQDTFSEIIGRGR
ncbi:putative lipid II flippase FtsW [Algicella marina]|uniref:Probable peptidoglycan glycosyltransferase FtsW n=1 Tax=Algicella marina TaxID=2683284 RepID=A0A6P1SYG7_9RHOB|nr:putative lipid II flippase FtsW [Algicella marina]QHQ34049.1 putative lipid II flippase FtsW [Algicella marina]